MTAYELLLDYKNKNFGHFTKEELNDVYKALDALGKLDGYIKIYGEDVFSDFVKEDMRNLTKIL